MWPEFSLQSLVSPDIGGTNDCYNNNKFIAALRTNLVLASFGSARCVGAVGAVATQSMSVKLRKWTFEAMRRTGGNLLLARYASDPRRRNCCSVS